jgi:hypothetical protein
LDFHTKALGSNIKALRDKILHTRALRRWGELAAGDVGPGRGNKRHTHAIELI